MGKSGSTLSGGSAILTTQALGVLAYEFVCGEEPFGSAAELGNRGKLDDHKAGERLMSQRYNPASVDVKSGTQTMSPRRRRISSPV